MAEPTSVVDQLVPDLKDALNEGVSLPPSAPEVIKAKLQEALDVISPKKESESPAESSAPVKGEDRKVPAETAVSSSAISPSPTSDIVYWKNPVLSGLTFVIGNVFFLAVLFGGYSVISLISYLLLVEVGICFIYVNLFTLVSNLLIKKPQRRSSARPEGRQVFVTRDVIRLQLESLIPYIFEAENTLLNILLSTDNTLTLKGIAFLLVAAVAGRWFSLFTLLYLGFLGLFSVPKLYSLYQREFDSSVAKLWGEAKKYYGVFSKNVLAKIPRASDLRKKNQ